MGYKDTIIKAVKTNRAEFDNFALNLEQHKVLNPQTVKFRFIATPVFGEFRIDTQYSSNPQPKRVIDVEVSVWGKVKLTLQGKPELRTKDFLKFVDLFENNLYKVVNKAISEYKNSLKPAINQFGRKIIVLDSKATNKEIENLVLSGYEVQVRINNNVISYGINQAEVDLFYSKKSA